MQCQDDLQKPQSDNHRPHIRRNIDSLYDGSNFPELKILMTEGCGMKMDDIIFGTCLLS